MTPAEQPVLPTLEERAKEALAQDRTTLQAVKDAADAETTRHQAALADLNRAYQEETEAYSIKFGQMMERKMNLEGAVKRLELLCGVEAPRE
jgi:hypothetical protein